MPKNLGSSTENTFIQGLITEATGMNFPEHACSETWNTRFYKKGNVRRRLGYRFENNTSEVSTNINSGVTCTFIWRAVAKDGNTNFLVVQGGDRISFYEADTSGNYSANPKSFSINLNSYRSVGSSSDLKKEICCFASGDGKLFICCSLCEPIYVIYNEAADTISVTKYTIKVRDYKGVSDGLQNNERPTTLSDLHKYNLFNQGWNQWVQNATNFGDPIQYIYDYSAGDVANGISVYPSNSDVWWLGKNALNKLDDDAFFTNNISNSLAPRGYYIYNAFDMDRASASGIVGIPGQTSNGLRPSVVEFYAGRIWYTGVTDPQYTGRVYYTQIIQRDDQIGVCHQVNDPSSEQLSQLLDSDGGEVNIIGMASPKAMFASKGYLFIFAINGVWQVSGSGAQGTGFVATDYAIQKVSDVSMSSPMSLVDVEGAPVWWNFDGIWTLQPTNGASYETTSLSLDNIRTFFIDTIPANSRVYAQGAYNPVLKTIQWLWRSTDTTSVKDNFKYDRILEFNVSTGAFYPHEWDASSQYLSSIYVINNINVSTASEPVTDLTDAVVTDLAAETVYSSVTATSSAISADFRYIVNWQLSRSFSSPGHIGFCQEADTTYTDFTNFNSGLGYDYSSYFKTGAKVHGGGDRQMQILYLTILANSESNSSCRLQAKWDWSNSSLSGRWTTTQQVYDAFRSHVDVSRKRLLIRGAGQAVQFHFKSETKKPFDIIGWSTWESVNAAP